MDDIQPINPAPQGGLENPSSKTWGVLCHVSSLVGLLGVPFGTVLGPLLIWLVKRKDHPFIDAQGKESLNFQLTMLLYAAVAFVLMFVLVGFLLMIAIVVFDLVMVIIASVKVSNDVPFRYPLTIRMIK